MALRLTGLACLALVFLTVAASAVPAPASSTSDPCADGRPHLQSYHFLVNSTRHERLAGNVRPGENFTVAYVLVRCGEAPYEGTVEVEMPSCMSPTRAFATRALENLDASNATDDVERSLVRDVREAMSCRPTQLLVAVAPFAPLTLWAVASLGAAIYFFTRRKNAD